MLNATAARRKTAIRILPLRSSARKATTLNDTPRCRGQETAPQNYPVFSRTQESTFQGGFALSRQSARRGRQAAAPTNWQETTFQNYFATSYIQETAFQNYSALSYIQESKFQNHFPFSYIQETAFQNYFAISCARETVFQNHFQSFRAQETTFQNHFALSYIKESAFQNHLPISYIKESIIQNDFPFYRPRETSRGRGGIMKNYKPLTKKEYLL
jgi:hypothetical protein